MYQSKTSGRLLQIIVAFSEYLNFTKGRKSRKQIIIFAF